MSRQDEYTKINAETWDDWADGGCEWSIPVTPEECNAARRGEWGVYLTPTRTVPRDWFPPLDGLKILGLASGGGQQMPIFSLLGQNARYSTIPTVSSRVNAWWLSGRDTIFAFFVRT